MSNEKIVPEMEGWRLSANRSKLIGVIRSPLAFFALALLIVEAFLLGAGIFFQLSPTLRVVMIIIGVALFLLVFGSVYWLVIKYPTNLVFSESSHLQFEQLRIFGSDTLPMTGKALSAIPAEAAPSVDPERQLNEPREGD